MAKVKIQQSNRADKKYRVTVDGQEINFGASGYRIKPGTDAGDSYCARSLKIKGANDQSTANYWARQLWSCQGDKSVDRRPFFGKYKLP